MLSLIEKDVLNQPLKPYQPKNVCIYEILSHFRMMIKWLKIQTQKDTNTAIKISEHMLRGLYW